MQEEIFKDIPGYEGLYQVSNIGNVKSLPKQFLNHKGDLCTTKKRNLKLSNNGYGYLQVFLYNKNIRKNHKVHKLVAIAFLGHTPDGTQKIVVDHINNNPSDNRLENLQLITQHENLSKDKKNKTSKYKGVCWDKNKNKWKAYIFINKKNKNLGSFDCELHAFEYLKEYKKNIL